MHNIRVAIELEGGRGRHSDGGLGEGHSEVVVLSQIVVMEFDE